MSLEAKIQELIEAVCRLTDAINADKTTIVAPAVEVVQPVVTPAPVASPVVQPVPVVEPAPAPVMPAPPSFVAPAPLVAPAGAPFTDGKGLIDYVMSSYKALGAEKGAKIQGVLIGLGYQNINDVKPEHYAALFAGVEALK